MKKKNKPDLTLRNARAYNKRFAELFDCFDYLDSHNKDLAMRVSKLELENKAQKDQLKKIMKYFQEYFETRDCKGLKQAA